MVKCDGPGGEPGTSNYCPNPKLKVRSCQGDLWLCSRCEETRFGNLDLEVNCLISQPHICLKPICSTPALRSKEKNTQLKHDFAALVDLDESQNSEEEDDLNLTIDRTINLQYRTLSKCQLKNLISNPSS